MERYTQLVEQEVPLVKGNTCSHEEKSKNIVMASSTISQTVDRTNDLTGWFAGHAACSSSHWLALAACFSFPDGSLRNGAISSLFVREPFCRRLDRSSPSTTSPYFGRHRASDLFKLYSSSCFSPFFAHGIPLPSCWTDRTLYRFL